MFVRQSTNGHMVEVVNLQQLLDLNCANIIGRYQNGEEAQDEEWFSKADLEFLSGEPMPQCWQDPHYRDSELQRH